MTRSLLGSFHNFRNFVNIMVKKSRNKLIRRRMKRIIVLIVINLVFMYSYVSAENIKIITADELKDMLGKKTKLVLVDARPQEEFNQGHIPQAVNIQPDNVGDINTLLPKNKRIKLIFYCRGIG